MSIIIKDVKTIVTAPAGMNLVVVKVTTSEPELYGVGCATFAHRHLAVQTAIEEYIKPLAIGKDVNRIEDIWQMITGSGYWRNGPVLNNAVAGLDMALWDIKGKLANMPLYDILGGKCREGALAYRHADGPTIEDCVRNVEKLMEMGYQAVRCNTGAFGSLGNPIQPEGLGKSVYCDADRFMNDQIALCDRLRSQFGYDLKLIVDVHERLHPSDAIRFNKEMEKFRLFFIEDILSPEHWEWFEQVKASAVTPIAMGELFSNPVEWIPLISRRLIDFVRAHISYIGGITPAIKMAKTCEIFGVRTAWHGPEDISPIGHAVNLHLSLSTINFGIQEITPMSQELQEVFPGCPEFRKGYLYLNHKPGIGVDINEKEAAKYPAVKVFPDWLRPRNIDGTPIRP